MLALSAPPPFPNECPRQTGRGSRAEHTEGGVAVPCGSPCAAALQVSSERAWPLLRGRPGTAGLSLGCGRLRGFPPRGAAPAWQWPPVKPYSRALLRLRPPLASLAPHTRRGRRLPKCRSSPLPPTSREGPCTHVDVQLC